MTDPQQTLSGAETVAEVFTQPPIARKSELIWSAFRKHEVKSFVDLGGCWGVHGAYTFQALLSFDIERAFLIDSEVTEKTRERAAAFPQLELLDGFFGEGKLVEKVDSVDAVIMHDVLLHQVAPDWNELIDLYAPRTKIFVIHNPMWMGSNSTIRLFDLGMDDYAKNIPIGDEERFRHRLELLKSRWDEVDPVTGQKFQDVHGHWQWGMTVPDLVACMWANGFTLELLRDYGVHYLTKHFHNNGFVFRKMGDMPY